MQKNPPGFKPGGFFTLSFSHVKKQAPASALAAASIAE